MEITRIKNIYVDSINKNTYVIDHNRYSKLKKVQKILRD